MDTLLKADICEELFSAEWLKPCLKHVEMGVWLEMCKFEVCKRPTEAEKRAKDIVVDYVLECGRHNPTLQPVCTWATELNLDIAKCPYTGENLAWNGCMLR